MITPGARFDHPNPCEEAYRLRRRIYASLLALSVLIPGTASFGDDLKFIPKIELRETYNDNIFLYSNDVHATNDFYASISPEAKISNRTERLDAFIHGRLNIIKYRVNDELDATDQYLNGRLGYRLSERWNMASEAGYIRDSQIDRDIETTGLVLGTTQREHQHYAINTSYNLTEKASSNVSYAYDKDAFNEPDLIDSQYQEARLGLTYDLSSFLSSTYSRVNLGYNDYDSTKTSLKGYSCMAGISMQLSETFSISMDAGYQYTVSTFQRGAFTAYEEMQTSTQGTIGQVALTYKGEKADASLSAYHYEKPLSGTPGTTMRSSVRLDLNRRITYKCLIGLSLEYFLNKANQGEQAITNIDEETWRAQLNMRYNLTNDIICEGTYRYTQLNNHVAELESRQNMAYLRIIWQYPIPH